MKSICGPNLWRRQFVCSRPSNLWTFRESPTRCLNICLARLWSNFSPVYIGRFFNFIRGISPQRRNEMGVGSKLRDKSDLVSNRRHYIQTLPPPYVLLYRHTSKKGEFWITQKYNISEIKNGQMFQIFYEEKLQMCKKGIKNNILETKNAKKGGIAYSSSWILFLLLCVCGILLLILYPPVLTSM